MDHILSQTMKRILGVTMFALPLLFVPQQLDAQNKRQLKKIQDASKIETLQKMQQSLERSPSVRLQLKEKAKKMNLLYEGQIDGKKVQLIDIDAKGRPLYYTSFSVAGAITTATDKLWPEAGFYSLEGENFTLYQWDEGSPLLNHKEYVGRVSLGDATPEVSGHSTQVAGVMVGSGWDPAAKGMAPKAKLIANDWDNDISEMTAAVNKGALLANASYGTVAGWTYGNYGVGLGWYWLGKENETEDAQFGAYYEGDQAFDLLPANAPYFLLVQAAGNSNGRAGSGPAPGGTYFYWSESQKRWMEGTSSRLANGGRYGLDCIPMGTTGKNALAVGAVETFRKPYSSPSDVVLANFSSTGPVNDGRIKPDLCAAGTNIYMPSAQGPEFYGNNQGTSFSAPGVTGSLLLLQELFSKQNEDALMKSATLKALAINTTDEAGENPGPDYKFGWGVLNSKRAADAISQRNTYSLIDEKTLENGSTQSFEVLATGREPLKVTIAWVDPAAAKVTNLDVANDRTPMLVNDLDLRVTHNDEVYLPWKLDPNSPLDAAVKGDNTADNVEQVVIENPIPGQTYTITVSHKGHLKQNRVRYDADNKLIVELEDATKQDFSIVVTGVNNHVDNDVAITDLKIKKKLEDYSEQTPVDVVISNFGYAAQSNFKIRLTRINLDDNNAVEETKDIVVEQLAQAETKTLTETLDLSKGFVHYQILAEVVSDVDAVVSNNKLMTQTMGIVADLRPQYAVYKNDFEMPFAETGWVINDADQNQIMWRQETNEEMAISGSHLMVNFPFYKANSNDWLISNPIKLKGGVQYRISFYAAKYNNDKDIFSIRFGGQPYPYAMNSIIEDNVPLEVGYRLKRYEYIFSVPTDQQVYIGFNHKAQEDSKIYGMGLDNLRIEYAVTVPDPDFTVSNQRVSPYDVVSFKNETITPEDSPVTGYTWSFEPNTVTFMENTTTQSENPKVKFNADGKYKVSLTAVNKVGSKMIEKKEFITVTQSPLVADFTASKQRVEPNDNVVFTSTSEGFPAPTGYHWTFTPSDGIVVVGEKENDPYPMVKFTKEGQYTVSLTVTGPQGEASVTKENCITVATIYHPVRDIAGTFNAADGMVKVTWKRPIIAPSYQENFEKDVNGVQMPRMTINNANNDAHTWQLDKVDPLTGAFSISNPSAITEEGQTTYIDVNDWLLTPAIPSGAEYLKMTLGYKHPERFDVFIVEATEDGTMPTITQMLAGHKVYTVENESAADAKQIVEDIREYTERPFHIAVLHRTTKEDRGDKLVVDNIEVGYDNDETMTPETASADKFTPRSNVAAFGLLQLPKLMSYEIRRNDKPVGMVAANSNTLEYSRKETEVGEIMYDVYSVYANGERSEKARVAINTGTGIDWVSGNTPSVYIKPTASQAVYIVGATSYVTSLSVTDLTGNVLSRKDYHDKEVVVDLKSQPKGVYLLHLVTGDKQQRTFKVVVR